LTGGRGLFRILALIEDTVYGIERAYLTRFVVSNVEGFITGPV